MTKIWTAMIAAGISAATVASSAVPAFSAPRYGMRDRGNHVQQYCSSNPRDRDCNDFRNNRSKWNDARYQRWYRDHRSNDSSAAALFGFAAGAVVAGAAASAANSANDHVSRCAARYRSYDARTDTFVGTGGVHYRCNL